MIPLPTDSKFMDLTGRRFGRLKVLSYAGKRPSEKNKGYHQWDCVCDCGNEVTIAGQNLRTGTTQSCGCLHKERTSETSRSHGESKDPLYNVWNAMLSRCMNHKVQCYERYGGRGISVDQLFLTYQGFRDYLESSIGFRPSSDYTLDRIDNNIGYAPGNLRWATRKEQARNRRSNRLVVVGEVEMTLAQAAESAGLPQLAVLKRLNRGWPIDKALNAPLRVTRKSEANSYVP